MVVCVSATLLDLVPHSQLSLVCLRHFRASSCHRLQVDALEALVDGMPRLEQRIPGSTTTSWL